MILLNRMDALGDGAPSLGWFLCIIVFRLLGVAFHMAEKDITRFVKCSPGGLVGNRTCERKLFRIPCIDMGVRGCLSQLSVWGDGGFWFQAHT